MSKQKRKNLRALIVDDEALARRGLILRLKEIDGVEVVGEAKNGREAVAKSRELKPDLLFLDIQMPGMNGFDVVRELSEGPLPVVLFVTAYDQFAVDAFEVNAVDYLLKPIEVDRLQQALDKARTRLGSDQEKSERTMLLKLLADVTGKSDLSVEKLKQTDASSLKPAPLKKLAIRDGGKTTWVRQEDIDWVDAAGDYMCVHALGETHIMRRTMKQLESQLDAEFLQRIHRSTIVNVKRVKAMQAHMNGEYFLTLDSGHSVKLSRTYKDKLKYL